MEEKVLLIGTHIFSKMKMVGYRGLILSLIHIFFDMGRTVVNITGDASCCIIVSNMERKKDAKREIARGL